MIGLNGMRVVSHPLAVIQEVHWEVQRHAIKKRRRSWHPVKVTTEKPSCFQYGNTFYVHPTLYEQLKAEIARGGG